ncbi:uncharacterized protein LOC132278266 [Cornus florida]|uniref:uncharacterized protein LOC132278266 n=1 Tax=Cornus florida TaxID=4283 RepID=UPI0028989514|nr:uncharacterized protein LOC132278266 [Cornus florida]
MHAPQRDQPLFLYVISTPRSIGALLAQEIDNQERPIYYISRLIHDAEKRYSLIEKHCLALVFAAHKFRHYFLAHRIILITKCDPYRNLLSKPMLTGKATRWLLSLAEFDITYQQLKAIKSQALADLLAQFPNAAHESVDEQLSLDDLQVASLEQAQEWHLSFDGSSTTKGEGAGIVLFCLTLTSTAVVKLDFKCINNEAEYEALILGLLTALDKQVSRLCIDGDSKLIVKQTSGEFAIREPFLASYRIIIQKLLSRFTTVHLAHISRSVNRYSDALATLASKLDISGPAQQITVHKQTQPAIASLLPLEDITDWRRPIID